MNDDEYRPPDASLIDGNASYINTASWREISTKNLGSGVLSSLGSVFFVSAVGAQLWAVNMASFEDADSSTSDIAAGVGLSCIIASHLLFASSESVSRFVKEETTISQKAAKHGARLIAMFIASTMCVFGAQKVIDTITYTQPSSSYPSDDGWEKAPKSSSPRSIPNKESAPAAPLKSTEKGKINAYFVVPENSILS